MGVNPARTIVRWCARPFQLLVQALITLGATVVISPTVIFLSLFGKRESARGWVRRWCRAVVGVFVVKSSVSGIDNLPGTGGCIMVANHSHRFEGPCLLLELGFDFDIAISRRLSMVPLWGQAAVSAGFLVIDRWNGSMAGRRIRRAVASVRSGRRILFFPEGRRTRSDVMLPFKNGAFRLAVDAQVAVVPIAVIFDRSAGRGGSLAFSVGEPIPTAGLGRKDIPFLKTRSRVAITAMRESRNRVRSGDAQVNLSAVVRPPGSRRDRPGAQDPAGG